MRKNEIVYSEQSIVNFLKESNVFEGRGFCIQSTKSYIPPKLKTILLGIISFKRTPVKYVDTKITFEELLNDFKCHITVAGDPKTGRKVDYEVLNDIYQLSFEDMGFHLSHTPLISNAEAINIDLTEKWHDYNMKNDPIKFTRTLQSYCNQKIKSSKILTDIKNKELDKDNDKFISLREKSDTTAASLYIERLKEKNDDKHKEVVNKYTTIVNNFNERYSNTQKTR